MALCSVCLHYFFFRVSLPSWALSGQSVWPVAAAVAAGADCAYGEPVLRAGETAGRALLGAESHTCVSGLACGLPVGFPSSLWMQPLHSSGWLFPLGCFISEPLESRTQVCLPQKSQLGQGIELHMPF